MSWSSKTGGEAAGERANWRSKGERDIIAWIRHHLYIWFSLWGWMYRMWAAKLYFRNFSFHSTAPLPLSTFSTGFFLSRRRVFFVGSDLDGQEGSRTEEGKASNEEWLISNTSLYSAAHPCARLGTTIHIYMPSPLSVMSHTLIKKIQNGSKGFPRKKRFPT